MNKPQPPQPQLASPDDRNEALQFEYVEPAAAADEAARAPQAMTCAACGQPITDTYYAAGDKVICPRCRDAHSASRTGGSRRAGRLLRRTVFGILAGLAGAAAVVRRAPRQRVRDRADRDRRRAHGRRGRARVRRARRARVPAAGRAAHVLRDRGELRARHRAGTRGVVREDERGVDDAAAPTTQSTTQTAAATTAIAGDDPADAAPPVTQPPPPTRALARACCAAAALHARVRHRAGGAVPGRRRTSSGC